MIQVAILTQQQYEQVQGQFLSESWKFNCALDANNNWTLGKLQIDECTNTEFEWLKQLPLVQFQAATIEQSTTGSL